MNWKDDWVGICLFIFLMLLLLAYVVAWAIITMPEGMFQ
jgi:hypothetical protein